MLGFTLNDTLVKVVAAEMNMGQIMFVRGFFASLLIVALAWSQGALRSPGLLRDPMVLLRAFGELGATVFFLTALSKLPLATVLAVIQALPLAVTMGAALFFKERVGWRRWLAIAVGFVGVMIIVRPGAEGFNAFALLALVSVLFGAVRDLATKRIPEAVPSLLVSVATAIIVTLFGAATIQPLGGWQPISGTNLALLVGAAVLLLVGYQFIVLAMRQGEISFISPFRYTSLLWALPLGFLVFGDVPDLPMILGASIIVASGLYTLYRERVVGARRTAARSAAPEMAPDGV